MPKQRLDKQERELLESIENNDQWRPVKNMDAQIKKYAAYAKLALKKDQRISIRMSKQDLVGIQTKAMGEGIPYQTLITSLVHPSHLAADR